MNAVEIESAISDLAIEPFDRAEFPYAFLAAFGNKDTTLKKLRAGNNNASDLPGAVLLRNNIHISVCDPGTVGEALKALRASPATAKAKAKFILATDGQNLEAEELASGETIACAYADLPNHFGFLLPLAGISTIKEIKDNPIDVRATSRLNKLYVELLNENPDWAKEERRADMNHFMARLVFCFFAEDTDIFNGEGVFTQTIEQMSERDGGNTHEVLEAIFRAMNIKRADRANAEPRLPAWADKKFPYVNGGLFSGSTEVPRFTRMARTYLLHAGGLNWREINPDIFGSMIQAVADDEERGSLGMHYTSVPNILKVLNPLFLDELRAQLEAAGDNKAKLLNLRKRMARIRVFDPACGSGNFLVIAYKQMREIEAEINRRRDEPDLRSEIPLTNFRGIELRDFPAEIARLALIIAEYQCDVLYRGQKEALAEFLPLDAQNWIVCGNALRLDWLSICPPTGTGVKVVADDLFGTPLNQSEIDFANEGGETYICGNPPYKGSNWRTPEQTEDLGQILGPKCDGWKALDYVAGWILKAAEYSARSPCGTAFVTTNSVCQGIQASVLWPLVAELGQEISFAHTSFKWANLASHNAGVSVIVVGLSSSPVKDKFLYEAGASGVASVRRVEQINAYLLNAKNVFVTAAKVPLSFDSLITDGSGALDGGNLILSSDEYRALMTDSGGAAERFVRPYLGSSEFIRGMPRWCLWIEDADASIAAGVAQIAKRIDAVRKFRASAGTRAQTAVSRPHKFAWTNKQRGHQLIIPTVFSERRDYITAGLLDDRHIVSNAASIVQSPKPHVFSIISSTMHIAWVRAVAGRLKTDIRYTSALCYNTFPVPLLTEQNKADLTACAEDILLAREAHFPATIADLYDPENMPDNLRRAHERNDEVLERIYIGRRFKNDTERLEKLFELYTKMTAAAAKAAPATKATRGKKRE
ncbi:class I SAM-dependent DNA methyltransferase [Uliginosibacterium aquaticum]|uniref:site-specific DNA-methyltransferase (adenine-specific) n=1 Tax=Uliginosibacterium aquaticum TaxID=2731212 RepID=A0ABX2IC52_9RHOO|nr:class I SAM-dependent DNA methyltransferase [Uliginosibacterium aquaticum]NSL53542.1 class I SAM-dependent DNA methyltransferase [Uliginosibacterium aquaticum]